MIRIRLDLGVIDVPTLVLNGEHESKSVFRHADEMKRLIKGAEMKVIPGAGHVSNMEKPGAFNAALDAFLTRLL